MEKTITRFNAQMLACRRAETDRNLYHVVGGISLFLSCSIADAKHHWESIRCNKDLHLFVQQINKKTLVGRKTQDHVAYLEDLMLIMAHLPGSATKKLKADIANDDVGPLISSFTWEAFKQWGCVSYEDDLINTCTAMTFYIKDAWEPHEGWCKPWLADNGMRRIMVALTLAWDDNNKMCRNTLHDVHNIFMDLNNDFSAALRRNQQFIAHGLINDPNSPDIPQREKINTEIIRVHIREKHTLKVMNSDHFKKQQRLQRKYIQENRKKEADVVQPKVINHALEENLEDTVELENAIQQEPTKVRQLVLPDEDTFQLEDVLRQEPTNVTQLVLPNSSVQKNKEVFQIEELKNVLRQEPPEVTQISNPVSDLPSMSRLTDETFEQCRHHTDDRISVYDAIGLCNPGVSVTKKWQNFQKQKHVQDIMSLVENVRINGAGKSTPVAYFKTIQQILEKLPGAFGDMLRKDRDDLSARARCGDVDLQLAMPIQRKRLGEEGLRLASAGIEKSAMAIEIAEEEKETGNRFGTLTLSRANGDDMVLPYTLELAIKLLEMEEKTIENNHKKEMLQIQTSADVEKQKTKLAAEAEKQKTTLAAEAEKQKTTLAAEHRNLKITLEAKQDTQQADSNLEIQKLQLKRKFDELDAEKSIYQKRYRKNSTKLMIEPLLNQIINREFAYRPDKYCTICDNYLVTSMNFFAWVSDGTELSNVKLEDIQISCKNCAVEKHFHYRMDQHRAKVWISIAGVVNTTLCYACQKEDCTLHISGEWHAAHDKAAVFHGSNSFLNLKPTHAKCNQAMGTNDFQQHWKACGLTKKQIKKLSTKPRRIKSVVDNIAKTLRIPKIKPSSRPLELGSPPTKQNSITFASFQ
jgi:hypothetical protein